MTSQAIPREASRKVKEMVKETRLGITAKKDEDFGKWYSEACRFGELVEYYESVKGCYILKPSGISDEYLERYTNVLQR